MSLKLRRGTTAERLATVFEQGELIYTTDSKQLYAGDGTTLGGTLVSYEGSVQGALGGDLILNGNDITGQGNINITQGTIFAQGNITTAGNLVAQGNVIAQGNVVLGDGENGDTINFEGSVNSNILPAATDTYALGSESQRWDTLHVNNVFGDLEGNVRGSDSTVLVDASTGTFNGELRGKVVAVGGQIAVQGDVEGNVIGNVFGGVSGIVLGSIFNDDGSELLVDGENNKLLGLLEGSVIGDVTGNLTGNVTGSVFANDSTILVDSDAGVLRGELQGNLVGNVQGNVTGNVTGDVAGNVYLTLGGEPVLDVVNSTFTGTVIGSLITSDGGALGVPGLNISFDTITGIATNEDIFIEAQGTGRVDISRPLLTAIEVRRTPGEPVLVAGTDPGQVDIAAPVAFIRVVFDNVEVAIPAYAINPLP